MMDILGAVSRNPRALVWMGNVSRLREIFSEEPDLAKRTDENGSLFFSLPEDEDRALEIAELLLASGADPDITNKDGITAIEYAEKQGLDGVVDALTTVSRSE
jgi:uncharacterized protein